MKKIISYFRSLYYKLLGMSIIEDTFITSLFNNSSIPGSVQYIIGEPYSLFTKLTYKINFDKDIIGFNQLDNENDSLTFSICKYYDENIPKVKIFIEYIEKPIEYSYLTMVIDGINKVLMTHMFQFSEYFHKLK